MLLENTSNGEVQTQEKKQPRISHFELSMFKTVVFIEVYPLELMEAEPHEVVKIQCTCAETEFILIVNFEPKSESATLSIQATPIDLHEWYSYVQYRRQHKISGTLYVQQQKKFKEGKSIKLSLQKKDLIYKLCLRIDIIVENVQKYNSKEETGFCGIVNNAATCYMNSVFQILCHLGAFQDAVYQIQSDKENEFPCTLQQLFYNLRHSQKAIQTNEIIRSFKWDKDQQAIQQDVQEFVMELLKAIENKGNMKMHLFEGELENHIKNDHFDQVSSEKFMDLQLNVQDSLINSLRMFTENELLFGENAYMHENLGLQDAYKFHKFKTLPPILMINIKRYQYMNGYFQKLNDSFSYPSDINFKEFMTEPEDQNYTLYAVLVHRGEAINHGHYYCYIRPFYESLQWFKFDDKVVTRASHREVFESNFGGVCQEVDYDPTLEEILISEKTRSETAYQLIYILKGQPHILEQPNKFPKWIKDKEEQLQEALNLKKNYIESTLVFDLNGEEGVFQQGIIYHREALNQLIDMEVVQQYLDNYGVPLYIPKQSTVLDCLKYIGQLLQIQNHCLFLYKVQGDQESIQYMDPLRSVQSYLNQKFVAYAIIISNVHQIAEELESITVQQSDYAYQIPESYQMLVIKKIFEGTKTQFEPLTSQPRDRIVLEDPNQYIQVNFQLMKESSNRQDWVVIIQNLADDLLQQQFQIMRNKRQVLIKNMGDSSAEVQIFDKADTVQNVLEFIAQWIECNVENIQIKYKDKKGIQVATADLTVDQITSFDINITFRQTSIPVNCLREQMQVQIDGKNYVVSKQITFEELIQQEQLEGILLIQHKKEIKTVSLITDLTLKVSRVIFRNHIHLIKPIEFGQDLFIIVFIQSVEIRQLDLPKVIRVGKESSMKDIYNGLIASIGTVQYCNQTYQFNQLDITQIDGGKITQLDYQIRMRLNNQEIDKDSLVPFEAFEMQQLILAITFLNVRDNKTDKLREKGVQIC